MDIHENFDPPVGDDDEQPGWEDSPAAVKLMQINQAMDRELEAWNKDQLDLRAFGVSTINLDNQVWSLVEYLKVLIPEFDETEYEYRWRSRFVVKINELRNEVKKQQTVQAITQGIIGPNGAPIDVDRNK
jgi:hypothetical protein